MDERAMCRKPSERLTSDHRGITHLGPWWLLIGTTFAACFGAMLHYTPLRRVASPLPYRSYSPTKSLTVLKSANAPLVP
jgi:hypothetical protein